MSTPPTPTDEQADVIVVEADPTTRTALAARLGDRVTVRQSTPEAFEGSIADGPPLVVVLGPSFANDRSLRSFEALNLAAGGVLVVLVAPVVEVDILRCALETGLREVVGTDEVAARLRTAVEHLVGYATTHGGPSASTTRVPSGEVIAVVAAKGGVGVTTVAVNMAAELAGQGRRVALIDADTQFGDVAIMMGLGRGCTLLDAIATGPRLNTRGLRSMMTLHEPTGVSVLRGAEDPGSAELIRPADLTEVVGHVSRLAEIVIIDVPSGLNDLNLALLDAADRIVLVTAADLANIKNARLEIALLARLHLAAKTRIVVNRVGPLNHAGQRRLEHHLGIGIVGQLPEASEVTVAETTRTPFVVGAKRSHSAKAMRSVCDALFADATPTTPNSEAGLVSALR